jgi:hypothetical protein
MVLLSTTAQVWYSTNIHVQIYWVTETQAPQVIEKVGKKERLHG